ncbi:hypothetical protein [Kaistella sp.]|uniref:hypothetical protein n=1 Tax=Kaistella sp. TaxID=2782235 RepID=UPI003C4C5672
MTKQYICLKKNYNIKLNEQSGLLTENEFKKKFRDEIKPETPIGILAEQKDFMYSLQMQGYDYRIRVQKAYCKCIKKKEIDW